MRPFGGSADEINDVRLLLFMGILGLAANIGSIFILASQSEDNMNMKAAFLEVMNDALGSVAVIVSAIVLICTGWSGFDAVAGGIIALMMIPRAIKLLRTAAFACALGRTPNGLDLDEVRTHLEQVPHVIAVHDLHASTVSTGMPILMAHVVVERDLTMKGAAEILAQLQDCLREHFPYRFRTLPSSSNRRDIPGEQTRNAFLTNGNPKQVMKNRALGRENKHLTSHVQERGSVNDETIPYALDLAEYGGPPCP